MKRVLCPGEALIDFVASEKTGNLVTSETFIKKAGGAPANAAGAMVKMGVSASFAGSVGKDPFGLFLKESLEKYQIDTELMTVSELPTTLAFVNLSEDGERDFIFNRGADEDFQLDCHQLGDYDCIHFASATAFLGGKLYDTYRDLLAYAKQNKLLVTFDANYRDALFGDNQQLFIDRCLAFIKESDIVKLSEEEAMLLAGTEDICDAGTKLQNLGANYVLITQGAKGTTIFSKDQVVEVPTMPVEMVDSTGAGDAFIGAVVAQAISTDVLTEQKMEEIVKIANKVGAITTQNFGGLESVPNLEQLELN